MRFTSFIVVALAGLVAAKGNKHHNGTASTKDQCKHISKLTKITDLAANTTKLAEKADNNATLIDAFKAKAAEATTQLATLTTNATLMDACTVIFAENEMEDGCEKIAKMEKANAIVANETLLAEHTDNNATKAEAFKAKVVSKAADLTALSSNTTLTSFCQAWSDKQACKSMAKLEKSQALAANTTALTEKFGGNAEKVAQFQAKLDKANTKMTAMMSNTTLIDTCKNLGITVAAATGAVANAGSAAVTTGDAQAGGAKSAAVNVKSLGGGQIFALVSAFIYALAVL